MDDESNSTTLPIHGQPAGGDGDGEPAVGSKVYVTLEEKVILDAMRQLRAEAETIREQLAQAAGERERSELAQRLEELRDRRGELAERREAAYRRKMIMLGHIQEDE